MKSRRSVVFLTLLILAVCSFIFTNSLQSPEVSASRSNRISDFLRKVFPFAQTRNLSVLVRKAAHFAEFMFLSFFITLYFMKYKTSKLLPLLMGLIVAAIDESLQFLIPGRGPAVGDVLIDFTGTVLGFIIIILLKKAGEKDNGHC